MTSTATAPPRPPPRREPTAPARPARRHTPAWLVLPSLVLLVAALGYPVGWQVVTSFQHFGMMQQFGQPPEWVGLANYASLVTDPELWVIVGRSIVFCLVCALVDGGDRPRPRPAHARGQPRRRLILQVALLLAWAMPVVALDDGVDVDRRLAQRPAQLGARARRRRRPGPQLARRAALVLRRRSRHRRLDERALRRPVDLRRPDARSRDGGARGGRDRRRQRLATPAAHHPSDHRRRSSRSSCCSSSSGT